MSCNEQVQRLRLVITDKIFIQHCKAYLHHRYQHSASNSCFTMQHYISNLISLKANKTQNLEVKGPTSVGTHTLQITEAFQWKETGFFLPSEVLQVHIYQRCYHEGEMRKTELTGGIVSEAPF